MNWKLLCQKREHEDTVSRSAFERVVAERDAALRMAERRWIPVEEGLPEHLSTALVLRKDGGIFIWEYSVTSPTDECWLDDYANVYPFSEVTHWMPLPEPPEQMKED